MGKVPYDEKAVKAINDGVTIVDIYCDAGYAAQEVFNQTMKELNF